MQPSAVNTINGYRVERLTQARLSDLSLLHEQVYKKKMARGYFAKKYDTAYTKVMYLGFLAYDENGLPAAFYGVIPCFIQYDYEPVLAAQSADTMTHPAHRNKGLFVQLANLTYNLCREEGIKILFGFPNQNSLPGFINKLNWRITSRVDCFEITVNTWPLAGLLNKFKALQGLYSLYVKMALKGVILPQKGIPNSLFADDFGGVYRGGDYLQYKAYNQTYTIKLGTASVWFKIQNGLVIGDIAEFEAGFDGLLKSLIRLAKTLGLGLIRFQVSPRTKLHALLMQYAKPTQGFSVITQSFDPQVDPQKIDFTFADIDIF